ncbi:MAG: NUDIX domain-containing protein [Balneolaceae bacterium]|nr:NUDIX domain-containing protein [Balneolaceae bacterium]
MSGDIYKNKTRIRVNGLLFKDDSILLAQIKSPVNDALVWMPPGGGLHFGERIKDCLKREFREETGLDITVGSFVAINELVKPPFHAIEMYFKVEENGGQLRLGKDPEHDRDHQILKDLRWISFDAMGDIAVAPKALSGWISSLNSQNNSPTIFFQSN